MFVIAFIVSILGAVFSIFMYRYAKKREDAGLDVLMSSWGELVPIFGFIIMAILSFAFMIGVIGT